VSTVVVRENPKAEVTIMRVITRDQERGDKEWIVHHVAAGGTRSGVEREPTREPWKAGIQHKGSPERVAHAAVAAWVAMGLGSVMGCLVSPLSGFA